MGRMIGIGVVVALLVATPTFAEEGYLIPDTTRIGTIVTGPSVAAVELARPCWQLVCGVSPWVKKIGYGLALAQCGLTEAGYAKLGMYGVDVRSRVTRCGLNVGLQAGMFWINRWLAREDADGASASTLLLAGVGTVQEVRGLKKVWTFSESPAWKGRAR